MPESLVRERQLQVRDVTPADIADVARVHLAVWQAVYRGILSAALLERLSQADFERTWADLLRQPQRTDLAVQQGDNLRGYISFGPSHDRYVDDPTTGEIYGLYVHPDDWAAGAGQQLLGEAIRQLQERGFSQAIVWTVRDHTRARRFLTRNGFCLDGYGREVTSHGETFIEVRLSLEIDNGSNPLLDPIATLVRGER